MAMSTKFRERVRELYRAYSEGRFQLLLDEAIDDEIEYASCAPQQAFPYFGRGRGKATLLVAWEASRAEYEFLSYLPLLIVGDGTDAAAVIVQMRIRHRSTDRVTSLVVADFPFAFASVVLLNLGNSWIPSMPPSNGWDARSTLRNSRIWLDNLRPMSCCYITRNADILRHRRDFEVGQMDCRPSFLKVRFAPRGKHRKA